MDTLPVDRALSIRNRRRSLGGQGDEGAPLEAPDEDVPRRGKRPAPADGARPVLSARVRPRFGFAKLSGVGRPDHADRQGNPTSPSARHAASGASSGGRFLLSQRQPVAPLSGVFAVRGCWPCLRSLRTASAAAWAASNQAESAGFASGRRRMSLISPSRSTRPGAICSIVKPA